MGVEFLPRSKVAKQHMGDGNWGTAQCAQNDAQASSDESKRLKLEEARLGFSQRRVSVSHVGASNVRP